MQECQLVLLRTTVLLRLPGVCLVVMIPLLKYVYVYMSRERADQTPDWCWPVVVELPTGTVHCAA
jgi:hypothetical protein